MIFSIVRRDLFKDIKLGDGYIERKIWVYIFKLSSYYNDFEVWIIEGYL